MKAIQIEHRGYDLSYKSTQPAKFAAVGKILINLQKLNQRHQLMAYMAGSGTRSSLLPTEAIDDQFIAALKQLITTGLPPTELITKMKPGMRDLWARMMLVAVGTKVKREWVQRTRPITQRLAQSGVIVAPIKIDANPGIEGMANNVQLLTKRLLILFGNKNAGDVLTKTQNKELKALANTLFLQGQISKTELDDVLK